MRSTVFAATLFPLLSLLGCHAVSAEPQRPEDLVGLIQATEKSEIRESWGEQAGQCFTWDDYERFVQADRAVEVANQLKPTPQFQKLIEMIKAMPKKERALLLQRARETARPTWAMNGRISPEGTTDAGRRAGLLLAESITRAVEAALPRD